LQIIINPHGINAFQRPSMHLKAYQAPQFSFLKLVSWRILAVCHLLTS
jgi:hypothetical protein